MTTAFEQAAAEHHADRCNGLPIFEQDGLGQYTASCAQGDFEVTGCKTRREAGARFYGCEQPGLYGVMGDGSRALELVERLAEKARALRKGIIELEDKTRGDGLGRMEENVLRRQTDQFNLLAEFVNPDTGEMR